jgi:L-lactate dehydrogenase (cytochrome)
MVSSNASCSPAEIISASGPGQPLFFQLYKNADDKIAEQRVRHVESLGYKAIFLTVDAIVPGSRERDIRSPWVLEEQDNINTYYKEGDSVRDSNQLGTAGALITSDDQDMTWEKVRIFSGLNSI